MVVFFLFSLEGVARRREGGQLFSAPNRACRGVAPDSAALCFLEVVGFRMASADQALGRTLTTWIRVRGALRRAIGRPPLPPHTGQSPGLGRAACER